MDNENINKCKQNYKVDLDTTSTHKLRFNEESLHYIRRR